MMFVLEIKNMLPGFFVALFFDPPDSNAHITLLIRKQCTREDLQSMVNRLRFEIAAMLPLVVSINPEITIKGVERDVPTHDVNFTDEQAREKLAQLYSSMVDADSPFPTWSPHVTVDNEDKKRVVDEILEKTGGLAVLKSAKLKQLGFKDTLFEVSK